MKLAIDRFRQNISHVRNLGTIYKAMATRTTSAIDLSDILRMEIVMAVSALDHYIHEVTRQGMLDAYRGNRERTPAFCRFSVSIQNVMCGIEKSNESDWLEEEIRIQHSYRSFQKSNKIAEAIRLIYSCPLWEEVANQLRMDPRDVKNQLDLIVDRRNKIAHEADIDPSFPGSRWPISEATADASVDFIDRIVDAIHSILTA